ncbi:hypothetical protein LTR86_007136 [Recurvomyces mirabilis]|nr:hypothetical protein LTR86_007136 [Recurvomyces mirabilis]
MPIIVNDFVVLPLTLPTAPSYPVDAKHYLYLRLNAPKLPTDSTPREIFCVNVPFDATASTLKVLFSQQLGGGRVEEVRFEGGIRTSKGIAAPLTQSRGKKRKRGLEFEGGGEAEVVEVGQLPQVWDRELHPGGGTAVMRFVDKESAELALRAAKQAVKSGRTIMWDTSTPAGDGDARPLGSARYLAHHTLRYPDPATLQQSVDTFISAFNAQDDARNKELARLRAVPDEDGFITVTRGAKQKPAELDAEEAAERERQKKKRERKQVGEDFYRFQNRERRKEEQRGLVRGFEEDKRRLEELRARRGRMRVE